MTDTGKLTGLDDFGKRYLLNNASEQEVVVSEKGVDSEKIKERYLRKAQEDFINRAGSFTEDLIGFILDQKKKRNLTDRESIFGLALANINLRSSYCELEENKKQELETEWDEICWAAQCYYNDNT